MEKSEMKKAVRVNVRALVEFALEGGDLWADMQLTERMREGQIAHMAIQQKYPEGWESEVTVRHDENVLGVDLAIFGRMDGFWDRGEGEIPVIEEIKSTRVRNPERIGQDAYPVHWAQAHIYAYIVCRQKKCEYVEVRLTYQSVDGPRVTYTRTFSEDRLTELFLSYAMPYAQWVALLQGWEEKSRPTMRALKFPYSGYREGQRDMAANAYKAIKNGRILLCQAPTGIGKTSAALFPAIKAVGEGLTQRIFYLTARTTARRAAEDALDRMRERGLRARSVTLTAKEKICFMQGARCHPDECPYAAGYYDKRRGALTEAVGMERFGRAEIELLAREYEVCPFELSLDLCETADVIICDYNYVFDPVVHLKRFFDGSKCECALLIDEAHNLASRAREMLSAELKYADLLALRRAVARADGDKSDLYKATAALIKEMRALCKPLEGPSAESEPPSSLYGPVDDFVEACREKMGQMEYHEQLLECYFAALDYQRACDAFDGNYKALLFNDKSAYRVRIWCLDPAEYLRAAMLKTNGAVLFSGTLTPMHYYARISGVRREEGDALLELDSPFPSENLLVLRVPLDTRYVRREETAGQIARAILSMCQAKKGNYMACFPSHAYLQLVYERFMLISGGRIRTIKQESGMKEAEREAFIEMLRPNPSESLVAFIAMGGIFAEGVDLPGDRLSGAAIVGVGLPQPDMERELLAEAWNDSDEGRAYAYVYPGMERVLQAAGRVIRSEEDRGVVLLLDERYAGEEYRELLPGHWRVRGARDAQSAAEKMRAFWRRTEPHPEDI